LLFVTYPLLYVRIIARTTLYAATRRWLLWATMIRIPLLRRGSRVTPLRHGISQVIAIHPIVRVGHEGRHLIVPHVLLVRHLLLLLLLHGWWWRRRVRRMWLLSFWIVVLLLLLLLPVPTISIRITLIPRLARYFYRNLLQSLLQSAHVHVRVKRLCISIERNFKLLSHLRELTH
jgi:hypothetical protein